MDPCAVPALAFSVGNLAQPSRLCRNRHAVPHPLGPLPTGGGPDALNERMCLACQQVSHVAQPPSAVNLDRLQPASAGLPGTGFSHSFAHLILVRNAPTYRQHSQPRAAVLHWGTEACTLNTYNLSAPQPPELRVFSLVAR